MSTPTLPPAAPTVVTATALLQVQAGLTSTDPRIFAAAESVLSALVLHLRRPQATLPLEVHPQVKLLREFCATRSSR